ncbi:hypothetical protein SNEBB_001065 [Seison nebaliae]|nr:hypothetical protein SNEBB_001065 [Seison nebaliae]
MFSRSNDAKGEQLRDIYFNGETITESLPVAKEKNNKRIEELMSQLAIEKDSTILTAYLDETSLEIRKFTHSLLFYLAHASQNILNHHSFESISLLENIRRIVLYLDTIRPEAISELQLVNNVVSLYANELKEYITRGKDVHLPFHNDEDDGNNNNQ